MRNFVLTCCSTADLPASFYQERGIPFARFHYSVNDRQYLDDLCTLSPKEFYQEIRQGARTATSQVSPGEFEELWKPYLDAGQDILHISLSSGLSGVYGSASLAAEMLRQQYPERRIEVVDSLGASGGYGMLVEYAADLADDGGSIDNVKNWVLENRLHVHHWFFSSDLTTYFRGGRMRRSQFLLGSLLHICPLMNMNEKGELTPLQNVRTRRRVMELITDRMAQYALDEMMYGGRCVICHSDCLEDAKRVRDRIEARFPLQKGRVQIRDIGTAIGSHTGPGTVALFFLGTPRNQNCPFVFPAMPAGSCE